MEAKIGVKYIDDEEKDAGDGLMEQKVRAQAPVLSLLDLCYMFAFAFGNGVLLSSYFIVTLPIESKRIDQEASAAYLGAFVAVAGITQLVCPVIGMISDQCSHRWGKRRPFILYGGIVGVGGLALQWYSREHEIWTLYGPAFGISMIALNVIYSSMNGLISDFVPDSQVGQANGIIAMLTVCGAVCSFIVFGFLEDLGMFYMFYIGIITWTVLVTFLKAGMYTVPEKDYKTMIPGQALTCKDVLNAFYISPVEHRDFFLILVSRTLYYMGISSQAFLMYFLRDTLTMTEDESEKFTAVLAVFGQCCGILTALPSGYISDHLNNGRKRYIYLACVILAIGNLALLACTTTFSVIAVTCAIGGANGIYLTMDGSLAIDALPNKEEAARFLGIWGVGAFIGTALGPMIGGPVLLFYVDSDTGGYQFMGYAVLLSLSAFYLAASARVLVHTTIQ